MRLSTEVGDIDFKTVYREELTPMIMLVRSVLVNCMYPFEVSVSFNNNLLILTRLQNNRVDAVLWNKDAVAQSQFASNLGDYQQWLTFIEDNVPFPVRNKNGA